VFPCGKFENLATDGEKKSCRPAAAKTIPTTVEAPHHQVAAADRAAMRRRAYGSFHLEQSVQLFSFFI